VQLACLPVKKTMRARSTRSARLTEVPKHPNLAKRGGAWFERGDVRVHLGVEKDFRPARKAHIGFSWTTSRRIVAECRRRGLEIVDDEPLDGFEADLRLRPVR